MIILQNSDLDEISPCVYLPERKRQFECFLAHQLDEEDISGLLSKGWRKFGIQYFRPLCPSCRQCSPLRVLTEEFRPSRSQRRNIDRNTDIRVVFGPAIYNRRIFEIYRNHSRERFSQESQEEDFLYAFYMPSCPGLQSLYYLDDELIGVGFLDRGRDCLSSIYFAFDPAYSGRGIGTFSAIKEIEYARTLGLRYYYLGYYVDGSSRMEYKDRFRPREHYDWEEELWQRAD